MPRAAAEERDHVRRRDEGEPGRQGVPRRIDDLVDRARVVALGPGDLDMRRPAAKLLIGRDAFGQNRFVDFREVIPLGPGDLGARFGEPGRRRLRLSQELREWRCWISTSCASAEP